MTASDPEGSMRPGSRLVDLVEVMDTLRVKCPWDARQTHDSLTPHLLEETYEAVDALESGLPDAVREELGDVLLQVVFHARVAQERTDGTGYTIDDVATGIIDKLTRRHPHVFGDVAVSGPDEVKQNWDAIKAAERAAAVAAAGNGAAVSALDGVPLGQPALSLATQMLRRATRAGAPAELTDLAAAPSRSERSGVEPSGSEPLGAAADEAGPAVSELGRELFGLVVRAQEAGLDPELELRAAARAYAARVRHWESEG